MDCNMFVESQKDIPALGHDYSVVTTGATCEEDGVAVYTCACGDTNEEVIPALGHEYENGACVVCGAEDPNKVPATPVKPVMPGFGKSWKGWFEIIKPVFGWFRGR